MVPIFDRVYTLLWYFKKKNLCYVALFAVVGTGFLMFSLIFSVYTKVVIAYCDKIKKTLYQLLC